MGLKSDGSSKARYQTRANSLGKKRRALFFKRGLKFMKTGVARGVVPQTRANFFLAPQHFRTFLAINEPLSLPLSRSCRLAARLPPSSANAWQTPATMKCLCLMLALGLARAAIHARALCHYVLMQDSVFLHFKVLTNCTNKLLTKQTQIVLAADCHFQQKARLFQGLCGLAWSYTRHCSFQVCAYW